MGFAWSLPAHAEFSVTAEQGRRWVPVAQHCSMTAQRGHTSAIAQRAKLQSGCVAASILFFPLPSRSCLSQSELTCFCGSFCGPQFHPD